MKIALLGYGKMGKTIEAIALKRGHEIILKTSSTPNQELKSADVAIDFSVPSAAFNNISQALENNVPVISGTTGWLDDYEKVVSLCNEKQGAFIYASNFSLGVNIFFELNRTLAKMMAKVEDYIISLEEIHHTQKLDSPSGTAISLANDIIENNNDYNSWSLESGEIMALPINAKRIENVPGTHSIEYKSTIDSIEIKHTAHSREGFALGAVIAAEWIIGKKGVFSMKDVLSLNE